MAEAEYSTGDLLLRGTAKRKIHRKITQNAACYLPCLPRPGENGGMAMAQRWAVRLLGGQMGWMGP
jgi:hypothetical protein